MRQANRRLVVGFVRSSCWFSRQPARAARVAGAGQKQQQDTTAEQMREFARAHLGQVNGQADEAVGRSTQMWLQHQTGRIYDDSLLVHLPIIIEFKSTTLPLLSS